ncbi:cytochrome P450 2C31-like [Pantherophis guttatus]|uniref:Cytochrome P450 2C31-like n=1 Tax=Pantherophis guttatus TaxID=94885 RepID=A0A6P9DPJ0_PANGU|nr:cytochrome P450 2C31-like [Pantherophis guttatus]
MSITELLSVTILLSLLMLYLLRQFWFRSHYPSGWLPLPATGSLWQAGVRLYQETLSKQLKEQNGTSNTSMTPYGSIFNDNGGELLKQQKEIGQLILSKHEREKKGVESLVEQEAPRLVETFARVNGQPFDPLNAIIASLSKMVWTVSFGDRSPLEDKDSQQLTDAIESSVKSGGSFVYALHKQFSWLMKYFPGPQKNALSSKELVLSFTKKAMQKHKEAKPVKEPQDFIDFYLSHMEKNKGGQNSTYNEENLAECIFNFLLSAAESTAITLQWALLLMASHPDVQDKVHKEIEKVLGSSNAVGHQDWKKLPYTSAVIHEIQRTKHAFLFRIIKQCAKDVNIFGFLAPKGTFINPDLNSVLLDPKLWETPEKFNPSHFLDKDGEFVAKKEFQLLAGESEGSLEDKLARVESFTFFINLLKTFVFKLPEGENKTSEQPRIGLTTCPHSYKICAVPHHKKS